MLILADREDGRTHYFYVVDAHTHLGKEAVVIASGKPGLRTNVAKQTIDFYVQVQNTLEKMLISNDARYCYTKDPRFPFTQPLPLIGHLLSALDPHRNVGWLMDQFVAFPFSDITQTKEQPRFKATNNMLLRRTTAPASSLRIIPYCRVDPHDGDAAVKEVNRAAKLGARGLKLHPIAQNWLEEILCPKSINVVKEAVLNQLPVIFDCRYFKTAEDLYQLAEILKPELPKNLRDTFRIIIGHTCMEYKRRRMFEIIDHPNILSETSGLRSNDVPFFFRNLIDNIPEDWSSNIVYGTDFNYFTIPQTLDMLSYLFSWQFRELGATYKDIQKILGLNLLSCLRPYAPIVPPLIPPKKKRSKINRVMTKNLEGVSSSTPSLTAQNAFSSEVMSKTPSEITSKVPSETPEVSSKVPSEDSHDFIIISSEISSNVSSEAIEETESYIEDFDKDIIAEEFEDSIQEEKMEEQEKQEEEDKYVDSLSSPSELFSSEFMESKPPSPSIEIQEDVLFTPSTLQRITLEAVRPELENSLKTGDVRALILDKSLISKFYSDLITLTGDKNKANRINFLTYEVHKVPGKFSDSNSGVLTFSKQIVLDSNRHFQFVLIRLENDSATIFTTQNSALVQPKLFSLLRRYYPQNFTKVLIKEFGVEKIKREEEYTPKFRFLFP
ncbi:MAG: amidohydrolase family protein [Candidatus Hermodarchaeota archaeon]